MSAPGKASHEPNRHPAQVTADRLANTVSRYSHRFSPMERDLIGQLIQALEEIADGKR